jgi:hypothetical protein
MIWGIICRIVCDGQEISFYERLSPVVDFCSLSGLFRPVNAIIQIAIPAAKDDTMPAS